MTHRSNRAQSRSAGSIDPAPGLGEILANSTGGRLGRVDFSQPLRHDDLYVSRVGSAEPAIGDDGERRETIRRIMRELQEATAEPPVHAEPDETPRLSVVDPTPAVAGQFLDAIETAEPEVERTLSPDEVARGLVALMHRVYDATERHLESLETEAARRTEMLTAQAELDAELIRLHARREAHTLLTAARVRTGRSRTGADTGARRLDDLATVLASFADDVETMRAERLPEPPR
ncbi:hypothetical protein [Nocardioides acrostichi]|uniref:Uncharacterized protein n=1 Tax=Nocardioides acrostichi TaxID=2784339 RepID=A0A930V0J3_9ACTN|nr:hypothetical protein [Nocardioides acrostichi]MBF4162445.1 hypothetical protein [Nocardioides acrostichi]